MSRNTRNSSAFRSDGGEDAVAVEQLDLARVRLADERLMDSYVAVLYGGGRFDLRRSYLAQIQFSQPDEVASWLRTRISDLADFAASFVQAPFGFRTVASAAKAGAG